MEALIAEKIAELRELARSATPGPWTTHERNHDALITAPNNNRFGGPPRQIVADCGGLRNWGNDAAFIAAARTGVDMLLDAISEKDDEIKRLNNQIDSLLETTREDQEIARMTRPKIATCGCPECSCHASLPEVCDYCSRNHILYGPTPRNDQPL